MLKFNKRTGIVVGFAVRGCATDLRRSVGKAKKNITKFSGTKTNGKLVQQIIKWKTIVNTKQNIENCFGVLMVFTNQFRMRTLLFSACNMLIHIDLILQFHHNNL